MAIELVDFPIKMVIFHSYIKLPEGNYGDILMDMNGYYPLVSQPWCLITSIAGPRRMGKDGEKHANHSWLVVWNIFYFSIYWE